jgi:hypothetical protein
MRDRRLDCGRAGLLTRPDNRLATRDLKRVFALTLLVGRRVPQVGRSETRVRLLDAHLLIDALLDILELVLDLLQRERVRSLALGMLA